MKTTTCDQLQQKRTSKGKQKIPITRIVDKNSRQVTFTKRRNGLFGKCSQLCSQFPNTQFAVITFSVGGKPVSHGCPSVDDVVDRFLNDTRKDGSSGNVVDDGNNWWETLIDDMKLDDLEKFKVALEGLKKDVASRVDEIGCFNEPECVTVGFNDVICGAHVAVDANFDTQMSDYCEQSTKNFNQESFDFPDVINCNDYDGNYASPSPKFSDNCREIPESFDLGSIEADVGNLFDVIKSVNFGCNIATISPESSDCPELMESIDFESVDATLDAQVSDFSPEINSLDFGCNDEAFSPQFCDNPEITKSFDLAEVLKSVDADASLSHTLPDKSHDAPESFDFGLVDANLGAQLSDFCPEIKSIDFRCNDETFSPHFSHNSQERRKSFDLAEALKSVDAEGNDASVSHKSEDVTERFYFGSVDASLGAQGCDYSSWMDESIVPELFPKYLPADDSYLLGAVNCC